MLKKNYTWGYVSKKKKIEYHCSKKEWNVHYLVVIIGLSELVTNKKEHLLGPLLEG
jgi:hypothetical protein